MSIETSDAAFHDIYTVVITGSRWQWRDHIRRGMKIYALECLFPSLHIAHSLSHYGCT